jgi:hypothetical protein
VHGQLVSQINADLEGKGIEKRNTIENPLWSREREHNGTIGWHRVVPAEIERPVARRCLQLEHNGLASENLKTEKKKKRKPTSFRKSPSSLQAKSCKLTLLQRCRSYCPPSHCEQ